MDLRLENRPQEVSGWELMLLARSHKKLRAVPITGPQSLGLSRCVPKAASPSRDAPDARNPDEDAHIRDLSVRPKGCEHS